MTVDRVEKSAPPADEVGGNVLVVESARSLTETPGAGAELVAALSSTSFKAEEALGKDNPFQLIDAKTGDQVAGQPSQEEIRKAIVALTSDALVGDGFSEESQKAFQRIFKEEMDSGKATPESIARTLNAVGAAINRIVAPQLENDPSRRAEPIGMAIKQNADGSYTYFMMLNKDNAAFAKNQVDLATGAENKNIIKLGPFTPGQPI